MALGPINYTTEVASPFESAVGGFRMGAGIREILDAREQADAQRQAEAQKQQDIADYLANPHDAKAAAGLTLKYPALRESVKQSMDTLNDDQRRGTLDIAHRTYAALQANRPEIAQQVLGERIKAMRNSGASDEEVQQFQFWADAIKDAPDQAKHMGALFLASADPDKFTSTYGALQNEGRAGAKEARDAEMHPLEVQGKQVGNAKTAAEAQKAGVEAKYADQTIRAELEKKGVEVQKLYADMDIAKQNARIAAMNAATAREGNSLKKQELQLKLEEAVTARDDKVRAKVAEVEQSAATMDNLLNTVERVKANKSLGYITGPIAGRLPSLHGEGADAINLLDTLKSQTFLAQVPLMKGMGQLTEAEGARLERSLGSLERNQTEESLRKNLDEIARLTTKARTNLSRKSGVQLQAPDTPDAKDPKGGKQKTVTVDW